MTEYIFYCWISLLIPSRDEKVITEFLRAGYSAKALSTSPSANLTLQGKGKPIGLLALRLSKISKESIGPSTVQSVFTDFADKEGISYYSCVFTIPSDCSWKMGNIDLSDVDSKTAGILKIGMETGK